MHAIHILATFSLLLPTVAPAAEPPPETAKSSNELPFDGYFDGEITIFPPFAPGSSPECNANFTGDPTAPGASITVKDLSQGVFTHMGNVQLEATTCLDPQSPSSSGHGVILAADGDQAFIEFENLSQPVPGDPSSLILTGKQWVTGGTGRFVNASGVQDCTLQVSFTSATTAVVHALCHGTIVLGPDAISGQSPQDAANAPWGMVKRLFR